MVGFLDRLLGRNNTKNSSQTAKERLQLVLVHDRMSLPPETLQAMKSEILAVISKYVSVDDEKVEIALESRDREGILIAEIPFLKAAMVRDDEDEDEDEDDGNTGMDMPQIDEEDDEATEKLPRADLEFIEDPTKPNRPEDDI